MKKDMATKHDQSGKNVPVNNVASIVPWFDDLLSGFRWFDDFSPRNLMHTIESRFTMPSLHFDETDNEYVITTDLPGMKKENISLECSDGQLRISAERRFEKKGKKDEGYQKHHTSMERSFTLPDGVDVNTIEASYNDGVLTVHIPKGESVKPKRIEINEAQKNNAPKSA